MPPETPGPAPRDDPYRYRRGWSATARVSASNRVRATVEQESGLVAVCEAAAEVVREIMVARSVSVLLMDESGYREIVNAGELNPDDVRFPTGERYPLSRYPLASARLLAREGYISADATLDVVKERAKPMHNATVGCFMGVPIVAVGEVRGELYLTRGIGEPVFTPEDLEINSDFATQLGTRIPALLQEIRRTQPDW